MNRLCKKKDGLAESEKVFWDIAFLCALLEAGKEEWRAKEVILVFVFVF